MNNFTNLLDFSLINHPAIISKILACKENIKQLDEFDATKKSIEILIKTSREKGLRALETYLSETNDLFLKDMICFVTEFISGDGDNLYNEVYYINKILLPHFLLSSIDNHEYLKDVIIYEAFLLIITGANPTLIQFRIDSILDKVNHIN